MKALSSTLAWACGESGTVLRTTDGGVNWLKATLPNTALHCYSIDALDANTAWVIAVNPTGNNSVLYKTANGGASWTPKVSSTTTGTFYNAVRFYDARNGIFMGDPENGYFVVKTTTDGGDTWTRTPQSSIPAPLSGEFGIIDDFAVFGNNAWFGTGGLATATIVTRVFRSTDRGKTWSATGVLSGVGDVVRPAFGTDQVGLALGNNGSVLRTSNGGLTWGTLLSTGAAAGFAITFVTPVSVMVVGRGGSTAYLSTDAGSSWVARPAPSSNDLYAVSFASSSVGWAVGASGVIYKWIGGNLPAGVPTISSFSPTSGPIGTTVTITGTNFSATPANNIVYFGAVRVPQSGMTSATSTSLSVTVPTGATYAPITVTVNGLTAYSRAPFIVTFPGGGSITASSFASKVDFTTGTDPQSVAIGDVDGDGKPDLVVANIGSNTVSVFRNTSVSGSLTASSFAPKIDFATETQPASVAIGDLDGDGKPDLVARNAFSNTVSVLRNTSASGSITFASKVDFFTGTGPSSVAIGDLDGDGKPDLAIANYNSNTVSLFRNTSASGSITAGSFASRVDFTTGAGPVSVAIGDLDGDGKADLVVAHQTSSTVSVFRNTSSSGSITFASKVDFATGAFPNTVAIGDLDGDGKPDLVVPHQTSNTVSVFRNTSTSGSITATSFASKIDFTAGENPFFVATGDIDGDGKPDLAVANLNSTIVSVFRNTSTSGSITASSFAPKVDFTTGPNPYSVAIGDLDGDGKPDLAVANSSSNTVSVFHNTISGQLTETEPNNTASQANSISYGDSLNASISPAGDVDYFRFTASAGDTVEILASAIGTSNLAIALQLYHSEGKELAYNDFFLTNNDARIVFAMPSVGTYYIRLTPFGSSGSFPNSRLMRKSFLNEIKDTDVPLKKTADPTGEYRIRFRRFTASAPLAFASGGVVNIYSVSAWVYGYVFPNGLNTTVTVQYGATTSYGQSASAGTVNGLEDYYPFAPLTGLSAGTTYNYRIVATNSKGTYTSANATFTTPPAPLGWSVQTSGTSENLWSVYSVNANVSTAVGDGGTILRTTNAGVTWSSQTSGTFERLFGVSFADVNNGLVVGTDGTILKTTNGGTTWSAQTSGTTNFLRGVDFPTTSVATAVGSNGIILRSTNGGVSWAAQSSGTVAALRGVSFIDANTGWVVGGNGTILKTTNGDQTWTTQTSGTTNPLIGVSFADANTGTAVGVNGTILRTTNGGTSWSLQTSGTNDLLWAVSFADANNGVVAGDYGLILRTTNGGASWTVQSTGTYNFVLGIAIGGGSATAVGEYGMILRSATATIALSTTSLSFGTVTVGSTSQQTFTVSNTGKATLTVSSVSSNSPVFTISPTSFSVAAGGATQTVTVTFAPTAGTSYAGTISLTHNASGSPSTVSVSGTGSTAPTISLSTTSISFGNVNVGASSQRTFTVSNTGNGGLTVQSISSSSSVFNVSPTSFSIAAGGATQTVTVTFAPTAGTSYAGTISLTHNASGSPSTVSVSGTGSTAPTISLSTTSISFGNVNVGASSQRTFTVSNTGTATLTVASVSSSTSVFTVSPTSFSVAAGGTAQTVTVTFAPTAGTSYTGTISLAHNATGSPSTVSVSGTGETATSGLATSTGRFSSGIPASSWVLMSVPYTLDNPAASTLSSQLTGSNPWKMYAYVNGNNSDITNASDAFQIARGFWFKTVAKSSSFTLNFGSGTLTGGSTHPITVPTSWSLIGPPFYNNEATWSPVNTTAGSSGIRVWKYAHESSSWTGPLNPTVEPMKPFGGYAVYNQTGAAATFTFTRGPVSTKIAQEWEDGDGWFIVLKVGNASLRIGEHRNASVSSDLYDYPMPPSPPDAVDEAPHLTGKLWSDIRPVNERTVAQWKIFINPSLVKSIEVEEMFGIPSDWKVVAQGIPNIGAISLEQGEVFTLPANINVPFTMTIAAGPQDVLQEEAVPASFSLKQNYPNPFNPATTMSYQLASEGDVSLKIFNVIGEEIATLVQGFQRAGRYEIRWDGKNAQSIVVPSGVYFYTLQSERFVETRKMLFIR